jgi:hypothetical protein
VEPFELIYHSMKRTKGRADVAELPIKAETAYRITTDEAMARRGDPVKYAQERAQRKK